MPTTDQRIDRYARGQRRLITWRQLEEAGLSKGGIQSRVAAGQLISVLPRVYAVGVGLLDRPMLLQAGVLFAGPRSLAARRTAAEEHELLEVRNGIVTVVRPRNDRPRMVRTDLRMMDGGFGLVELREATVLPAERSVHAGVAITTVPRTLVDIAGHHPGMLERAWKQAEFRQLLDPAAMATQLALGRRDGNPLVRATLADYVEIDAGDHGYDTLAEFEAVKIVIASGTPHPLVNHWVTAGGRRRRLDLYFPHARLCIEVDDWQGHQTRTAFEDDRVRDSDLRTIGIQTSRFTVRKFTREPHWCAARILGELQQRTQMITREAA